MPTVAIRPQPMSTIQVDGRPRYGAVCRANKAPPSITTLARMANTTPGLAWL